MRLINITFASELGIKAMMALSEAKDSMTTQEVARRVKCSPAHMSKILQRLTKGRLVVSARGPRGGYRINGPANMTAACVIEVVDGHRHILHRGLRSPKARGTPYKLMMRTIELDAFETLRSRTICDLAS
jgi:Rrf2 family protein